MNLIFYEIKSNIFSMIIWIFSLIGTFLLMMVGAYPIYSSAVDELKAILSNFPPEFISAFGMDLDKLFSYGGFYNFSFGYIGLIGGIMASALAISVFSREKRSKCSDFLLTKPIAREFIFINKLCSCFVILIITNLIYMIAAFICYPQSEDLLPNTFQVILAFSGLFFTQIVFLALGIAYAIFSKKVRSVAGSATIFGFGAFILSSISNIFDDKHLEMISPLKYFEPISVFNTGSYTPILVICSILLTILCIGLSFVKFCKSDVQTI